MKKRFTILIAIITSIAISNLIVIPILFVNELFISETLVDGKIVQSFTMSNYVRWEIFWFLTVFAFALMFISHKIFEGKLRTIVFYLSAAFIISEFLAYLFFALIDCRFEIAILDWFGSLDKAPASFIYWLVFAIVLVLFTGIYGLFINKNFFKMLFTSSDNLKQVKDSNLENSRWMNETEKKKIFKVYKYSELASVKKDGIPVQATLSKNGKDMNVCFNSPCHSIIIGSTGSGKTTTFVSPMIQLLGSTGAGSSMVITDPKGELFSLHSKYLKERGYDVKVVDLRDTYSSYRWNPLDGIYDAYTDYRTAHTKAYRRSDNALESGLVLDGGEEAFKDVDGWYEFEGKAYATYDRLVTVVKLYKKKIYDEVYEDLNDLCTILIPVENEKDPLWEKGARAITLAVLIAMLEDSANPELNLTKEKYNFFNLAKILQNSDNDYEDLKNYFKGRNPLSKSLSLSKQVLDAAPTTRASYMSIVYDKLTLFNDAGICALTSSSDFTASGLAERPTALFLKIPDEKDTRHNLAAIFILNIYKTLIKVASATEELTLPRNVYFIMDEFGNMPKIEKFDKFITVGRSRKIWFNMIVQSYAQLNNVYGETVADIVKGNCGIKMFIGSNDMGTCKEYSELCGNITVHTTSTSGGGKEKSYSTSMQVRPLIYPSELQRLNHPGDIGHSIIVTFGNYPFKTYFTPSFKVPLYKMGKMDQSDIQERYFDENEVFYDISIRNNMVLDSDDEDDENASSDAQDEVNDDSAESKEAEEDTSVEDEFYDNSSSDNEAEDAQEETKLEDESENQENETNVSSIDEEILIKKYREWKAKHPRSKFSRFIETLPKKTIKEIEEGADNQ
jgi:type IV secretory pathway TraG/TraD family ATPase VirD4